MPKSETVRGLERGIKVLDALREGPLSLHDVHRATGLPKPSLLRILNTLVKGGLVSRRLVDGHYRVNTLRRGSASQPDRHERVAEAAGPVLSRLCEMVSWPSDLLVPAGMHMERRETSRSHSPFLIHPLVEQHQVGQPINWLLSGVGRAYLAYCPERERDALLVKLKRSAQPEDRLAHEPERLAKILALTRKRGYGTRDTTYGGGYYGAPPSNDGLAAIAVPVRSGNRVLASVNILWIKSAFSVEDFAARHLGDLQAAAAEIAASIS